jgi:hypothetical protein
MSEVSPTEIEKTLAKAEAPPKPPNKISAEDRLEYLLSNQKIQTMEAQFQALQAQAALLKGELDKQMQDRNARGRALMQKYKFSEKDNINFETGEITREKAEDDKK